jgi:hypothetical protein
MHAQFWSAKLKERDHLEDLGVQGRMILRRMCLTKYHVMKTNLLNYAQHEDVLGSGRIPPRIFRRDTRRRLVISITLRPLYSEIKCSRYRMNRRLSGPQLRSERGGQVKICLPLLAMESTTYISRYTGRDTSDSLNVLCDRNQRQKNFLLKEKVVEILSLK